MDPWGKLGIRATEGSWPTKDGRRPMDKGSWLGKVDVCKALEATSWVAGREQAYVSRLLVFDQDVALECLTLSGKFIYVVIDCMYI